MGIPQHNPTKVLMETVKDQGYDVGDTLVTIESSRPYVPVPPLGPFEEVPDPVAMTEAQALTPKGPGDVHPVKFLPYSSDQGM
jgi:hypothetical protein